jgi:hypothetical protein
MNILKAIFGISWMLFRRFWWRMFQKYVLRDFHPLVFFYLLSTVTAVVDVFLLVRLISHKIQDGFFPPITMLAVAFMTITTLNSTFFAFWMDMQSNEPLNIRLPEYFAVRSEVTTGQEVRRLELPADPAQVPPSSPARPRARQRS